MKDREALDLLLKTVTAEDAIIVIRKNGDVVGRLPKAGEEFMPTNSVSAAMCMALLSNNEDMVAERQRLLNKLFGGVIH